MAAVSDWQPLFETWPAAVQCRGVVVSRQGEAIPFVNFMIAGGLLLLERDGPDVSGARKVMIAFDEIAIVKLPTAGDMKQFEAMGFKSNNTDQATAVAAPV